MSDATFRDLGDSDADVDAYVERLLRYEPAIWDLTADDVRFWDRVAGPGLRFAIDAPDGSSIGVAGASVIPGDDDPRVSFDVRLDPAWTNLGIGTRALARLDEWAAARRDSYRAQVGVDAGDAQVRDWWGRRGFRELDRFVVSEARFGGPDVAAVPRLVDGVAFTTLAERPELLRASYDASCEFRRDMPGDPHDPLPFEEYLAIIDSGERPPDSVVLALEGERIVGVCTLVVAADGRRAHTGFTGTAADWRGRGLGVALKERQVAWCRARGMESIRTTNHDDNASMRAINERAGFRTAFERVTLERGVAATR